MSDEIVISEQAPRRRRSSAQMQEDMARVDRSVSSASAEQIAHGDARVPRVSMVGGDLKLSVDPRYVANPDYYYRWALDSGDGDKIRRMQAAYYDFVVDENGANITKNNGGKKFYLMALHKKYRKEDDLLKKRRHDAMLGKQANEDLGVEGLQTYSENKTRESTEKF